KELVHAGNYVVTFFEWSAGAGACAHREHILGLCHLIIEADDGGYHFFGDGPGNNHQVRLTRRRTKELRAETGDIKPSAAGSNHFDGAARQPKLHGPDGGTTSPIVNPVYHLDCLVEGTRPDLFLYFFIQPGILAVQHHDRCALVNTHQTTPPRRLVFLVVSQRKSFVNYTTG